MQPHGLFDTVGEPAGGEDLDHLRLADHQFLLGQEPPEAFAAGRRGQAALVGEELFHTTDLVDGKAHVDVEAFELSSVVEVDHWAQLFDESRFGWANSKSDANDGSFMIICGDVNHVDLCTAAFAIDEMLRRRVDVPADVKDFLAVKAEAGETLDLSFGVMRCPGWSKLPVEKVSWDSGVRIALKVGLCSVESSCWAILVGD